MRPKRLAFYLLLSTSFLTSTLLSAIFLLSCSPTPQPPQPGQTSLFVYRFEPPALVEFSADLQPIREIPFSLPRSCGLLDVFSAPVGSYLLIELSCPNGQTVLLLDTSVAAGSVTDSVTQPITDSDAHFLAWTDDGQSVYLKVDALGNTSVRRVDTDGDSLDLDITGWIYDLGPSPNSDDFIFSFSQGLGSGSELDFTQNNGRTVRALYSDEFNYISFARYSPDGEKIAFIKIPDSSRPFTVGELWVMDADGSNARKLADADAGHGYAANWSPDGRKIAFVGRENIEDKTADQSSAALMSNIYVVSVENGNMTKATNFTEGYAESPQWSPDGNTLSFNVVINGRINVFTVDMTTGEQRSLTTESACCPAWMRK